MHRYNGPRTEQPERRTRFAQAPYNKRMDNGLGWLAGLLLLGAVGALVLAGWLQRRSGLPRARLIYSDTGAWQRVEESLFSAQYRLVGKPDYVLEQQGRIIPVEVKPSRRASHPQPSDELQLLAYCLLVEETWGRPPYGLLHYATGTFQIEYTEERRDHLLARIAEVRAARTAPDMPRSHDDPARCAACAFRTVCDQSLV
jgi:CRISPR-associated exonuclease Cas4